MGDVSEVNEDDVIVDGYCTADNGCEANWVEVYSHVVSQT